LSIAYLGTFGGSVILLAMLALKGMSVLRSKGRH